MPPEGSEGIHIKTSKPRQYVEFEYPVDADDPGTYGCEELPPGEWKLLGFPNEISEEVWDGLAHGVWNSHLDKWDWFEINRDHITGTATESGLSWCRANGVENCLLIVKTK